MLVRVTRSMRMRAGRLIALAYLFCVLAPAAALAWGHGPVTYLGDEVAQAGRAPGQHELVADPLNAGDAMHDHAAMYAHHHVAPQEIPAAHHHGGKGTPGPCCAMMCATALPAALPDVATPVLPSSTCGPEIAAVLRSEAPPLHYRPPIA